MPFGRSPFIHRDIPVRVFPIRQICPDHMGFSLHPTSVYQDLYPETQGNQGFRNHGVLKGPLLDHRNRYLFGRVLSPDEIGDPESE